MILVCSTGFQHRSWARRWSRPVQSTDYWVILLHALMFVPISISFSSRESGNCLKRSEQPKASNSGSSQAALRAENTFAGTHTEVF